MVLWAAVKSFVGSDDVYVSGCVIGSSGDRGSGGL